jgi:hypothetical protein
MNRKTGMRRFTVAIVGLAAAAMMALGACSSSGDGGSAQGGNVQQHAAVVLRQLVQCVRQHGVPGFPDGSVDANGVVHFPDDAPKVPDSAINACQAIWDRLPPQPTTSPPATQAVFRQWLAFARCMRAHGVPDWPDPNPDGTFPLPSDIITRGKAYTLPAQRACDSLNPDPDKRIYGVAAS